MKRKLIAASVISLLLVATLFGSGAPVTTCAAPDCYQCNIDTWNVYTTASLGGADECGAKAAAIAYCQAACLKCRACSDLLRSYYNSECP